MSTQETRSGPIPSGDTRQDIEALYREFQPKAGRLFKTAPLAHQLAERESVWFDDGVVRRGYVKLNGVLRSWLLT